MIPSEVAGFQHAVLRQRRVDPATPTQMSDDDTRDEIVEIPIDGVLDLHAFAPRDVVAVVEDYLAAAREKGLREVRLIHGRGVGVQRAAIHRLLRSLRDIEFGDAPESHLGATIVRLPARGDT